MSDNQALNIPEDRILEETRLKLSQARARIADLGEFGLAEDWLNELEAIANRAEDVPRHEEITGELKSLTAAKDVALADCVQWARKLKLRMEIAFDDKTPPIPFPIRDWRSAEKNESKAISVFPSLLKIARQQAAQLATAGQTDAHITEGETLLATLKASNEAQEEFKYSRTTITANRRQLFRELYDGVNRINKIGQMVYGADTPDGKLFTSHWQPKSRPQSADSEE